MALAVEDNYLLFLRYLLLPEAYRCPSIRPVWPCPLNVDTLERIARKNVVLVRLSEVLADLKPSAQRERERIVRTIELIRLVTDLCAREGIPYVLPKAIQHYPDMGHDMDLYVMDTSKRIDALLLRSIPVRPAPSSLLNWVAKKAGYTVTGFETPIEIHHGCLGPLGEHRAFGHTIFERRRCVEIWGREIWTPAPEDQLLIQALQRVYGHFTIRLSDAIHTVELCRDSELNWASVTGIAKRFGLYEGLCCYLGSVTRIYPEYPWNAWLPVHITTSIAFRDWGVLYMAGGTYALPKIRCASKAYWSTFRHGILARQWGTSGRVALLPAIGTVIGIRNLLQAATGKGAAR